MVYVTGDTHRFHDLAKLLDSEWPIGQTLTRDDYVVVCGDFGGVWYDIDLESPSLLLELWESLPWTTLFVDGNHENHDAIDAISISERFGAPVQVVPNCPHIVHLMRGYVYDLPVTSTSTARVLVMGGARSVDRQWRIEGESWWRREMPSDEEYDRCTASLKAVDWKVDYVLTHELPANLRMSVLDPRFHSLDADGIDPLSNYLQWVYDNLDMATLKMWYAGHHHVDRMLGEKCRVLYQDVVPITEGKKLLP